MKSSQQEAVAASEEVAEAVLQAQQEVAEVVVEPVVEVCRRKV